MMPLGVIVPLAAALAVIEVPIAQWSEITPGCGSLVLYATPADLV